MSQDLTLSHLLDGGELIPRLERMRLPSRAAQQKADLFRRCGLELMREGAGESSSVRAFVVPGRIEVLGKHTDYCGGPSLVAATEQGFVFAALESRDAAVRMVDVLWKEAVGFELSPDLTPPKKHWSNYPMTVARRLARNFPAVRRGAHVAFASDLPPAAGMSSSSAFVVGTYLVLSRVNGVSRLEVFKRNIADTDRLAAYLACVENGADFGALAGDSGVGTRGGSEDHTAILCSAPGALGLYSFQPVRLESRIGVPEDLVFVLASSGVVAEKTGGALESYNRASRLARAVVAAWREAVGGEEAHLAAVLAHSENAADRLRDILRTAGCQEFRPDELIDRLEHFAEEARCIVPRAVERLASGDIHGFGDAVDQSQETGARLLGNQVPETIALARQARDLGALAASAFGAGFGGSVWALVREEDSDAFLRAWQERYLESFPGRAGQEAFFTTRPSPAAFELL